MEVLRNTGNSCSTLKPVTGEKKYKTTMTPLDAMAAAVYSCLRQ